ncbi:unnamed protein product [Ixodes persulcatus]
MAAAVWAIASLVHCIAVSAEVTPDVSSVRWNRATHSRALLQDALQRDSAPFVEADVVLVDGSAVLPRPVNENWTVSLSELLYRVSATPMNVTLKLNLKSTEVLEVAKRNLLEAHLQNLKGLWFHADILPATGGEAPVNASTYLHPFASSFPQAVVSVGWTTYPETFYTWEVVDRMTRLLLCGPHLPARVSVAARASMLPNSVAQVSWMLDVIPQASLSIWAQDNDPRVTDTLIQLRKALPWSVVYYDLSEQQRADFERAKENVAYEPERTGHPVWDLPGVVACEQRPLAGRRSVILKEQGGSIRLPAAWKHFRARIDTSRSKTITLHMGSNSLTLNGDCFYVVARSTATAVIVSAWQCVGYHTNLTMLSASEPSATREWPIVPGPMSLRFQTPTDTAVYLVYVNE